MHRDAFEPLYGWYSPTAAKYVGTVVYTTPIPGQTVTCTLVNRSPICHNTQWEDIQLVGEVVRCVQALSGGPLADLFDSIEEEWDDLPEDY